MSSSKNGKTVTFAAFDKFLHDLGFQQTRVPGSHDYYEHPASGTLLMTRLHKPTDLVPTYTLISTQKTLEWRGLATSADFAQMAGKMAVKS